MRFSVPIIALSLVAAACGSDSATNPDAVDEAEAPTEIDAPAETDIDTDTPAEAESTDTIHADVTIEPGALAVGSVKIDGTTVQYVTITPAGFEPGDTAWVEPMQETLATLTDLGADATLEVVPGEGHIIGALSDGVRIFDELDASR